MNIIFEKEFRYYEIISRILSLNFTNHLSSATLRCLEWYNFGIIQRVPKWTVINTV